MANIDADLPPTDADGNPIEAAEFYYVQARDFGGNIASQGTVPEERLDKAKRLFYGEGWTVEVTEITDETADQAPTE
jgi:hypothetical protein